MLFFFFKQKTAYEMRISDWSSDVCSSDLQKRPGAGLPKPAHRAYSSESFKIKLRQSCSRRTAEQSSSVNHTGEDHEGFAEERLDRRCRRKRGEIGRASCRERVCQYV